MKENYRNIFFSISLLLMIFSSCDIKKIKKSDYSAPPKNAKEVIARVNSKNNPTEWLSLKGKINIVKADHEITLNINIKNRKDSLIWILVSAPFSIEIVRAQLTPDSIYFVNRTNKTWLIKPSSHISELLKSNISFKELQDMITANPRLDKLKYNFHSGEKFVLEAARASYTISEYYRVINASLSNSTSKVFYEFLNFDGQNFPRKIRLKIESNESFEATLNYSKILLNTKLKFPFKIPNSYAEVK
jgi:hypothetical protein